MLFLAVLSIYECICIKLSTSAVASQSVANILPSVFWVASFLGGWPDFYEIMTKTLASPQLQNSFRVPVYISFRDERASAMCAAGGSQRIYGSQPWLGSGVRGPKVKSACIRLHLWVPSIYSNSDCWYKTRVAVISSKTDKTWLGKGAFKIMGDYQIYYYIKLNYYIKLFITII